VNCIAYHVVAAIVGTVLAVIIMIVIALDLVELAVLDENPGGFVEHLCEDFSHLSQKIWASGSSTTNFLFILKAAVSGLYTPVP
jgi:hypothetical protein